jgi:Rrf2 family nitric oxide-sensitive transcriptional repressor
MRITSHTDYALRVLLFVGAAGKSVTISQISEAYAISKEHLRKVVHALSQLGYLHTTQGRYGGIMLAMPPDLINIRKVVDQLENSNIVECFDKETNTCAIDGMCLLKKALFDARESFMSVLAEYHLSDLIRNPRLVTFCQQ